jgi:8-oxo-dGTP pyrophosphatase MutT (NUDIX family)
MSHIIIYFGDKPVYLCDKITKEIEQIMHHPDAVFIDELSTAAINSLLHEINKKEFLAGIIFNEDFDKLKKSFFKHFTLVKTGGGLIKNESESVLLIFRRGKWDLPKGKQDNGETLAECALREVREETGLQQLKLGKEINTTYHTYIEFGKHILKESHWFLMTAGSNEDLVPQTEEDITEIVWVKKNELEKYFGNMFPTIISLLKNA